MARARIILAAVLAAAALAVLAGPATASAPAADATKFCNAYKKIGQGNNGNLSTPQEAKATLAKFKAAGKYAPAKIKKASNTIVSVLSKFAKYSATDASDVAKFLRSSDYRNYGKAISTYFVYAGTHCSGA
jgi:hypothetical protein